MTSGNVNICRLCLKMRHNVESIGDSLYKSLKVLSLSFHLKLTREAVLCKNCIVNLKKYLIYKTASLNLKDSIDKIKDTNVNLCLFCTRQMDVDSLIRLNSKMTSVIVLKMTMEQCFPELNLQANAESISICIWCGKNIQKNFEFIVSCLKVEQQIREYTKKFVTDKGEVNLRSIVRYAEKEAESDVKDNKTDLTSCLVIKKENCLENGDYESVNIELKIKPEDIKLELYNDVDINDAFNENEMCVDSNAVQIKCETRCGTIREAFKCEVDKWTNYDENSKSENQADSIIKGCDIAPEVERPKWHKCSLCNFKTKHPSNLRRHFKNHESRSEVTMHDCDKCPFQTLYKSSLNHHKLLHMNPDEIVMSKCDICEFQTKSVVYLRRHMLVHKGDRLVTMYKCGLCNFETKYKYYLRKHARNAHEWA